MTDSAYSHFGLNEPEIPRMSQSEADRRSNESALGMIQYLKDINQFSTELMEEQMQREAKMTAEQRIHKEFKQAFLRVLMNHYVIVPDQE